MGRVIEVDGDPWEGRYEVDPWDEENNPLLRWWATLNEDADKGIAELSENSPPFRKMMELMGSGPLGRPPLIGGRTLGIHGFFARMALQPEYGFAIPDKAALELIAKHSPHGVLEIGAGTGFWAMLLAKLGVDVVATDSFTGRYGSDVRDERFPDGIAHGRHFNVLRETHEEALADPARHRRTLLLCWPDYTAGWAAEALSLYRGDTVVYVGEGRGGCTADKRFYEILDDEWEEVACARLPQWEGIHDRLWVMKRRGDLNQLLQTKV